MHLRFVAAARQSAAILASAWLTLSASAADITGTWKTEFDTQIGLQKHTFTFKQDGKKVVGTATADIAGEKREVEFKDGKLQEDVLTFFETFKFQDNEVRIEFTGKVAGDEIRFTRKVGEFATEALVARRVTESAGADTPPAAAAAAVPSGDGPPLRRAGAWLRELDAHREGSAHNGLGWPSHLQCRESLTHCLPSRS